LTAGNVSGTRGVLVEVLRDRIVWQPMTMKDGRPGYELRMPIAFDRLLISIVPVYK
jgi:hypothetical protein